MGSVKSGDKSPSPVMNKSLSSSKFKNAKDDATLNVTASQPGLKKTGTQNKMDQDRGSPSPDKKSVSSLGKKDTMSKKDGKQLIGQSQQVQPGGLKNPMAPQL